MRPCVKKAASGDFGDRKSGQVWRGNADLTLRGLRRNKVRAPIADGPHIPHCGEAQENYAKAGRHARMRGAGA